MNISANLKKAVSEHDLHRVRAIILRQINSDRDQLEYDSIVSCRYAGEEFKKNALSLFDADNGNTEFTETKDEWTTDLWQTLRVEFEYNYSKLKFDHIILVMRHLREKNHPDFAVEVKPPSTSSTAQDPPITNNTRGEQGDRAKKSTENLGAKSHLSPPQNMQSESLQKKTIPNYAATSLVGAVVGGIAGAFVGKLLLGVIAGAIIGTGIDFLKKNSKE